ncbi:hypothetical protein LINPERPRIM_LOCUS5891, partial [Linum perenne]
MFMGLIQSFKAIKEGKKREKRGETKKFTHTSSTSSSFCFLLILGPQLFF